MGKSMTTALMAYCNGCSVLLAICRSVARAMRCVAHEKRSQQSDYIVTAHRLLARAQVSRADLQDRRGAGDLAVFQLLRRHLITGVMPRTGTWCAVLPGTNGIFGHRPGED